MYYLLKRLPYLALISLIPFLLGAGCDKKEETTDPSPKPVASFTFSPTSPEAGQEITFTNTSTNATTYEWSSDAGGFSSQAESPKFTFTDAGTFQVTLKATGEGGTGSVTKTITVKAVSADDAPVAGFTFSPTEPEAGQEITFTNTSTNASTYEWSSDAGGFSSQAESPKFTFTDAGTFQVTLKATGTGGTNSTTQTITVKAVAADAPVAGFDFSPTEPEAGEEISFTNTSTNATTYEWSSDAGGFSSQDENPKFTFTDTGTFQVTLKATGDGGTNSITKTLTVKAVAADAPVAGFDFSPTEPEAGEEISFTNTSTNATTYEWSSDAGGFSSQDENPKFTFTDAGTFQVTLKATGDGGTNSITKSITVKAPSGTGGGSGGCTFPDCYVTKTVTSAAGTATTNTYEYTLIAGQKLITKIITATSGITTESVFEYDAQGRKIKNSVVFNGFVSNYVTYEYSNGDKTVRANSYDANNNLTGYAIDELDNAMRLIRSDSYTSDGTLVSYVIYSDFVNATGSFPQLVETFDANNNLTQKDVRTYQNCQLVTNISTDGSGAVLGEIQNEIDVKGVVRKSTSTTNTPAGQVVSVTDYTYDCD